MKVFLIFLGLFILNLSFIAYHSDMENYDRLQVFLKALAEDCAAGAALYYDEEAYSRGSFAIAEQEGKKYVRWQTAQAESRLGSRLAGTLKAETAFSDTDVSVEITYEGRDLFRLPFLTKTTVKRGAKYEWDNLGK